MSPDSSFYRALASAADLVIVNLLTLLGCVPVVTAGASLAACTRVTMEMAREEDSYIVRSWWKSFRSNLRQSLIWWNIAFLFLVVTLAGVRVLDFAPDALIPGVLSGMLIAGAFILVGVLTWLLPLVAFFDNTVKAHVSNAAILAVGKLGYTVSNLLVLVGPVVIFVLVPGARTMLAWFTFIIGPAFIAYIQALLMRQPINALRDRSSAA